MVNLQIYGLCPHGICNQMKETEENNQYLKYLKLVAVSVKQSNRAETEFGGTSKGAQKRGADEENIDGVTSASSGPPLGKKLSPSCSILVI